MRKKIIAGNWKMNTDLTEGTALFSEIRDIIHTEPAPNAEIVIFPPFIHLSTLIHLNHGKLHIGAQNCAAESSGAFTGEVSARMLKSVGASYVLVGHSERRQYFFENGAMLEKKIARAIENGLTPIYCIGETKEEKEAERHFEVMEHQLHGGVFNFDEEIFKKVIIAYEPVWAIGTGLTASASQAQEAHAFIRKKIKEKYSDTVSQNTSIVYGGSLNAKTAPELFDQPDIDGGLVGGASLKAREFCDMAKILDAAQ